MFDLSYNFISHSESEEEESSDDEDDEKETKVKDSGSDSASSDEEDFSNDGMMWLLLKQTLWLIRIFLWRFPSAW